VCWLVCPRTWSNAYSRCSVVQLVWSTDFGDSERIQFKLAVLVHRVLHNNALEYLGPFTRLSNVPSRSSLRFSLSNHLLVPPVRRSTVGARAFPMAGPVLWNNLPTDITSIDSLPVFCHCFKNYLFSHSYPGAVQELYYFLPWPRKLFILKRIIISAVLVSWGNSKFQISLKYWVLNMHLLQKYF